MHNNNMEVLVCLEMLLCNKSMVTEFLSSHSLDRRTNAKYSLRNTGMSSMLTFYCVSEREEPLSPKCVTIVIATRPLYEVLMTLGWRM